MKFVCNSEELSNALGIVSKAISNKTNIPILEGIKISVYGETVTLAATDLELYIETKIKASVKLEGEVVVIGRFFTDFIKKLTNVEQIEIEKNEKSLVVRYNDNETEVQCLEEDTYPERKEISDDVSFMIKENDLRETVEKTIFCVAVDDSRPILKGCLLEVKDDVLTAVALDGYRLAICKCATAGSTGEAKMVIPGRTLMEIAKIFGDGDNKVKVNIQKNFVMFDVGYTKITTRLIEGDYIQYNKIIPVSFSSKIVVNKEILEAGLDRATLIAKNKKNYLKLSIANNTVEITSASELGKIRETVACTIEGKELDIAFNSKYLFDAFNKIKEDFIEINFSGSTSPAVIVPTEGDQYKYVVLPVRLMG